MKKIIIFLVVISFLTFSAMFSNTYAQESNTNQAQPQEKITGEEVKAAKKFLEQLVDTEKSTNQQTDQKTMANVLDKGIDLFAGYVTSVSDMLQKVAPDVWRIMIRQQYAKAISGLMVPFILLIICFTTYKVSKRWFKITPEDKLLDFSDEDSGFRSLIISVIPALGGIASGIWFANRVSEAVLILINPEYFALKDLLAMILGQQSM